MVFFKCWNFLQEVGVVSLVMVAVSSTSGERACHR